MADLRHHTHNPSDPHVIPSPERSHVVPIPSPDCPRGYSRNWVHKQWWDPKRQVMHFNDYITPCIARGTRA